MRSMSDSSTHQGIPTVYCQQTHANEALCSLMSAVLQRDVRSKRFDRNQRRKVKKMSLGGGAITVHIPQGRSNILILVVVHPDEDLAMVLDATIAIGTNRGHVVAGMVLPSAGVEPYQLRLAFMDLLKQNPGSELFVCSSDETCVATLSEAVAADGASRIGGWFFVGDTLPSVCLTVPSLFITTRHDLIQDAILNPCVILVSVPGESDDRWTSKCLIAFCEAESARRRHGGGQVIPSKL